MYTLRNSDEGVCPCCEEDLNLLTNKEFPDGYPAFLICFRCHSVVEVKGDNGERVEYKGGRRRKHAEVKKWKSPLSGKQLRLRQHQSDKRKGA